MPLLLNGYAQLLLTTLICSLLGASAGTLVADTLCSTPFVMFFIYERIGSTFVVPMVPADTK